MKKKIIYGVCMLSLVAMTVTSCKKNEETASTFACEEIPMEMDNDGRYYYDPSVGTTGAYVWEVTDQVKVFNKANNETALFVVTSSTGSSFQTTGPVGFATSNEMFAFFPYEMASEDFDKADERQTFVLGDAFNAKKVNGRYTICDGMFPKAAKYNPQTRKFSFKSIFGMARFVVSANEDPNQPGHFAKIKEIVVEDNVFSLAGTVSLHPYALEPELAPEGGPLKAMIKAYKDEGTDFTSNPLYASYVINTLGYSAQGTNKTITLSFEQSGYPTAYNESGAVCYFGLRPGSFAKGFKVYVTLDNDQTITLSQFANPDLTDSEQRGWVIEPNKIKTYFLNIDSNLIDWNAYN